MAAVVLPALLLALAGCATANIDAPGAIDATDAIDANAATAATAASVMPAIALTVRPLSMPLPCTGRFEADDLDHRIRWHGGAIRNFDTIGSGLGVGDIDNDGDIDLVLANLAGPTSVFWNHGGLQFERQELRVGATRAVNLIDYDGDGWLDLALTHPAAAPTLWLNRLGSAGSTAQSDQQPFAQVALGARYVANAMAWADLDTDGDLDLVTGSYNSELQDLGGGFAIGGGVAYYEQRDGALQLTVLAPTAEALAVLLVDVDGDQLLDIVVGNDYVHPDQVFVRAPQAALGWIEQHPFAATATNTMSYDAGDLDNDGTIELFAADMKPYPDEPQVAYTWERIMINPPPDDVQRNENVLLRVPDATASGGRNHRFQNVAPGSGVDATGWTWSAKFGDLDNDGYLDLYAVNGMIDALVFGHLPGDELVEANQALRNRGDGTFTAAAAWALSSQRSGRGMSMADLDDDGDLDIVVNNMREPAQLFENRLCGGRGLLVDVRQPGTGNTRAIGARVSLQLELPDQPPMRIVREVRSQSGYLSGDASRLHFGIPAGAVPLRLEVRWPDAAVSVVAAPPAGNLVTISRSDAP